MTRLTIDAPAGSLDAVGGLLGVANLVPPDESATFFGVNYLSVLSGHSRRYVEGEEKVFDELPTVTGDKITLYRGIDTSLLVQSGVGDPEVLRAFNASAGYGVEQYTQEVLNGLAVDITPTAGTPVTNVKAAVGMLEQWIADRYSGLPLLHANKYGTELMTELSIGEGHKLHTPNSTPVANGAGYGPDGPGGLTADPGEAWVYISGPVNIWQGGVEVLEGPALKQNRNLHLAEASYVVTVDGPVAAILIGI